MIIKLLYIAAILAIIYGVKYAAKRALRGIASGK